MKVDQSAVVPQSRLAEAKRIGALLARLRHARRLKQSEAALRAGISRNTAYRLESGDPGVALGQVLRYLEAIAAGVELKALLAEDKPSLAALTQRERGRRVRGLTAAERKELDF